VNDVKNVCLTQLKGWLWVKNHRNMITMSILCWLLCSIQCLTVIAQYRLTDGIEVLGGGNEDSASCLVSASHIKI